MTKARFIDDGKVQCERCSGWTPNADKVCADCRAKDSQRAMELISAPDCPACGKAGALLRHWSSPNGCMEKSSVVKRG